MLYIPNRSRVYNALYIVRRIEPLTTPAGPSPDYPGLQLIHEKPYIFIVNNFLKKAECELLLAKVLWVGSIFEYSLFTRVRPQLFSTHNHCYGNSPSQVFIIP